MLNIKHTAVCVKGIDFIYNDETIVKTGFDDETIISQVDLSNSQRLYAVKSYIGSIVDMIEFQTINPITGEIKTIVTGNAAKTVNYEQNTQSFSIDSFYGTYYDLYDTSCLEDLSLSFKYIKGE